MATERRASEVAAVGLAAVGTASFPAWQEQEQKQEHLGPGVGKAASSLAGRAEGGGGRDGGRR